MVRPSEEDASRLEKTLRVFSVVTLVLTIPQVFAVWMERQADGVSLISWSTYLISACLWFVYGVRKRDKTIYLACIGWIIMDAAIVAGVILHG